MTNFVRPARFLRAASLALLATTCSVGVVAMTGVPAFAQTSTADLQAISQAVTNAVNAAKSTPGATQAQIDAAVSAAISSEMQALIAQYSGDSPLSVAEAVITAANDAGASQDAIGNGAATAALAEGANTGTQIADAMAATGTQGSIAAFQTTALASNTTLGRTLAADAGTNGTIGAGGGGGGGGGGTVTIGGGGGGGGGGGCTNPSCT